MFKQEIPLMYPLDDDVLAVKEAFWDPFEYLLARYKDSLMKLSSVEASAKSPTMRLAMAAFRTSITQQKKFCV